MSNGLYLPTNETSSTSGFQYHRLPTNVQESNRNNSTASELPPEYYSYLTNEIQNLKSSINDLQRDSDTSKTFFKESVLLQRVCLVIIVLFPLLLAAITAVVVWRFSTEPTLVNYAKWCLGILGLSGVIDLIFIFATHKIDVARIEQIERRLDKFDS